jgi:hypothetical protein
VLTAKPNGKKLSGRHRCRRKNNIKIDTKEIWWGYGLDSFDSVQGEFIHYLNNY